MDAERQKLVDARDDAYRAWCEADRAWCEAERALEEYDKNQQETH